MEKLIGAFVALVIGAGIITALALVFTFPFMWLINGTFSAAFLTFVFGTATVTFWKAFALSILVGWVNYKGSKD